MFRGTKPIVLSLLVLLLPLHALVACESCCGVRIANLENTRLPLNYQKISNLRDFYLNKVELGPKLKLFVDRWLKTDLINDEEVLFIRNAFSRQSSQSDHLTQVHLSGSFAVQASYKIVNDELIFSIIDLRATDLKTQMALAMGANVSGGLERAKSLSKILTAFFIEVFEVSEEFSHIKELVILARSVHLPEGPNPFQKLIDRAGFIKMQTGEKFATYSIRAPIRTDLSTTN